MNEIQFFSLPEQLWSDLAYTESYYVALMLAAVLFAAWQLSSRLKEWGDSASSIERGVMHCLGAGGLWRLVFPAVAAFLVMLLRAILMVARWEHLSLLDLAMPLIFSWALVRVIVYVFRCVFPGSALLGSFERWVSLLVWGVFILHITGFAAPLIDFLDEVSFTIGKQPLTLWQLMRGTVTVCLTLLFALWLASLIEERLAETQRIDRNVRELLVRLSKSLLFVVALLFSLSLVGIDVTMLSVFGGALAVGLGFGLQKIASSYVSGFIILLDRSIRIGSLVSIDAGTTGTVTQITTRYTVLRTSSGADVLIPNEYLVSNMVRNLSFSDTKIRLSLTIQIAYSADPEKAMALMLEAAWQHPCVIAEPAPAVLLTDFADSGINLELGFWIDDPVAGSGRVRSDVALSVLKAFNENGIEIPYPQCEVRLLNPSAEKPSAK